MILLSVGLISLFLSVSTAGPSHGIKVINEGFYWYSGSITYIISLSSCLILLALFIKRERNEAILAFVPLAALLFVIIIGLNETSMFLICFTIVPWLFFRRNRWGTFTTIFLNPLVIGYQTLFFASHYKKLHHDRFQSIQAQVAAGNKTVMVPSLQKNELLLFEDLIPGTKNIDYAKYFEADVVLVIENERP